MTVLIDTPIWSIAYRRAKRNPREQQVFDDWSELVRRQQAVLIGPVRQEILCGFSNTMRFELIRATLHAFEDLSINIFDYEVAASFYNICRRKGVQGSPTDFLICAVSLRYEAPIFTTDRDFTRYAKLTGIRLHTAPTA